MTKSLPDISVLLKAVSDGDDQAWEALVPVVYQELKRLARIRLSKERPEHTLQPTALVHELFLRMTKRKEVKWDNRDHFFRAASMALNWILMDYARSRGRNPAADRKTKRTTDQSPEPAFPASYSKRLKLLDLALAKLDSDETMNRKRQVVNLRFFMGMTYREIAEELGVSVNTVANDWVYAKTWLLHEIKRYERYGI